VAQRRKVGNLLALAVLSVVVQRPMHPYEMASVLRARDKDRDMAIKWGSLYTVVRSLERHGLIEATGTVRDGARPARTIYRITDAGREELTDWVRELVAIPEREQPRFEAGLSLLAVLPPDDATELLRQRLRVLEEQIAAQRAALARYQREIPRLFLVEAEYDVAIRDAEASWIRSLLDDLTAGTFAGLARWRTWHETGQVPHELTDLAERGSTTS
jgi:DNA-binding PadR family transcriptional regulator